MKGGIKLSIDEVELDYNNPRIKQWLEIYGDEITSEHIALKRLKTFRQFITDDTIEYRKTDSRF